MAIKRKRRTQKATRKLDLTNIRNVLKDGLAWTCLGIVQPAEDGGSHFEIDDGTMLVQVELQPSGEDIDAHVIGGAFGWGVWFVPPIGAEVIVAIPDGETDHSPAIVGILASGELPSIVAEDSLVIVSPPGGKVKIEAADEVTIEAANKVDVRAGEIVASDGGSASSVALKSDVDTLKTELDSHIHTTTATVGSSTTPGVISPPTTAPFTAPAGTAVFKAE